MPVGMCVSRTAESVVLTRLAAGPAGAVDVDADLLLGDVDLVGLLEHRDHLDGGERRLPAALVVERADPHQPVGAGLDRERAVGVRRVDREGRRLEAGLLGVGGVEDLDGVLVALGPAGVHPHQHLGEVGGVDAAGAGADRDEGLAGVVLAGQQGADLELLDRLVQPGQLGLGLGHRVGVALLLRQLDAAAEVVEAVPAATVNRSSSPCRAESRPVTRWALAWSSQRSGAATCSPRSAISARMPSRSSTCSMVCIVAWSCLIWVSKSGPATNRSLRGSPARAHGEAAGSG